MQEAVERSGMLNSVPGSLVTFLQESEAAIMAVLADEAPASEGRPGSCIELKVRHAPLFRSYHIETASSLSPSRRNTR
jgi:hypothetical protein